MDHHYLAELEKIEREYGARAHSERPLSAEEKMKFYKFVAGLKYFHKEFADATSVATYFEFLRQKKLTSLEFYNSDRLEDMGILNVLDDSHISKSAPAIYYSFHIGSFSSCPLTLLNRGIDVALCFGADDYEFQCAEILEIAQKCKDRTGRDQCKFETINVESKGGTLSMLKAVEQGTSLFFFVDGNKGSNQFSADDEHLQDVKLLDGKLKSRKGIAHLAYILKLPLIPVVSYRRAPTDIVVEYLEPIVPGGRKREFVDGATSEMWNLFTRYFRNYPLQWASIGYCHQFREQESEVLPPSFEPNDDYEFNAERYDFCDGDEPLIVDFSTVEPLAVTKGYATLLRKIRNAKTAIPGSTLSSVIKNQSALDFLVSKEILISNRVNS